jgi:hypothetical protein
MRPTYEQLVELNPLLGQKSPEEVNSLIDAVIESGYQWREDKKLFYNPEHQVSVRTQGLDLFTAESFKKQQNTVLDPDRIQREQALRKSYKNSAWILVILFILTLFSFVWWGWKLGLLCILLMFAVGFISGKKRKRIREE